MIVAFYFYIFTFVFSAELPPPCDSKIYCTGELLRTVQLYHVFTDAKTFVDRKLKYSPGEVLNNFKKLLNHTTKPSKKQVTKFVEDNTGPGNELEDWIPTDYKADQMFLNQIKDEKVKNFAIALIKLWKILGRKVKPEVSRNIEKYSFLPVPNGFIIPGGRFSEFYYWDTYFIVKGLLVSEMQETVKGILENYVSLIKQFGFIPNGSRLYYINRSQPPLFTLTVASYLSYSNNLSWLRKNIKYLDAELSHWLIKNTLQVKEKGVFYSLARYHVAFSEPRPESYFEDEDTASVFKDSETRENVYIELKSGAETGWDFSSRWIFDKAKSTNLSYIQTSRAVPVDLNSILCGSFKELSHFYRQLGNVKKSNYWYQKFKQWRHAIKAVLWNEEAGIWFDYDSKLSKQMKNFYPSNISPLWTGCIDQGQGPALGNRAVKYLESTGALSYPGGIPTSKVESKQQWDFPNAWPPLQFIIVHGLQTSGDKKACSVAKSIAEKWINANMIGYNTTGKMFEKYDARHPGRYGGGGEYPDQIGFGWTNGVALDFIHNFFTNYEV